MRRGWLLLSLVALCVPASRASGDELRPDPQVGQAFRIPYQLTNTNHFLVRVRINGKGPFNFLVDSGAPALYVTTATAARIALKPPAGEFWTPIERLEFEGGARLLRIKARVEDPFQLVGMNALGLPGASIDGILGFTILARFRLQIDPTSDRMTWTRLSFVPPDPPIPRPDDEKRNGAPAEFQAMQLLGPLAKAFAFFVGKQPEAERTPRGFLGLEWAENPGADGRSRKGASTPSIKISRVLDTSPAALAGLRAGDEVVSINRQRIGTLSDARNVLGAVRPGDTVRLVVRRSEDRASSATDQTITITAGEGL